jgi:hypothetical protein
MPLLVGTEAERLWADTATLRAVGVVECDRVVGDVAETPVRPVLRPSPRCTHTGDAQQVQVVSHPGRVKPEAGPPTDVANPRTTSDTKTNVSKRT